MLFHKLNAIMEGRIGLIEVEISAGDAVIYLHSENETSEILSLPDWWKTADLTHSDFILDESGKTLSIPQATAWRDVDLAWPDTDQPSDTGNIVVFADFKSTNDSE
jgi:hypothetical protein